LSTLYHHPPVDGAHYPHVNPALDIDLISTSSLISAPASFPSAVSARSLKEGRRLQIYFASICSHVSTTTN
jgi:hypothetical protein